MNYLSRLRTNNTNPQTESFCMSYESVLHFLTNIESMYLQTKAVNIALVFWIFPAIKIKILVK